MDTIYIPNAPWWLPHSVVVVKEDFLAADEAWVNKQLVAVSTTGTGTNVKPNIEMNDKDRNILLIERMAQPGSVVAVKRANGRVKTVQLPQQADQLLQLDSAYIVQQIEALSLPPMTPEEQQAFLNSVSGQSGENSQAVS